MLPVLTVLPSGIRVCLMLWVSANRQTHVGKLPGMREGPAMG